MSEGTVAADELRLLIERIERLEEEKKAIGDDVKDVYGEAKARGYDTKTMRKIIGLRKMEKHVREEADMLLETYKARSAWLDAGEIRVGAGVTSCRKAVTPLSTPQQQERTTGRWPAIPNSRTSCTARGAG
jgi:uncharacterized protein (UPF0335 family)